MTLVKKCPVAPASKSTAAKPPAAQAKPESALISPSEAMLNEPLDAVTYAVIAQFGNSPYDTASASPARPLPVPPSRCLGGKKVWELLLEHAPREVAMAEARLGCYETSDAKQRKKIVRLAITLRPPAVAYGRRAELAALIEPYRAVGLGPSQIGVILGVSEQRVRYIVHPREKKDSPAREVSASSSSLSDA